MGKITVGLSIVAIIGLLIVGAAFIFGLLSVVEVPVPPSYHFEIGAVADVSASSWMVFDRETGEMLFEYDIDTARPIASVAKLLSAAMFVEGNDLEATTSITWMDIAGEGRAGKLGYGEIYRYRELLFPLLLESSNDAAAVMLRVDESLVDRMNVFTEANGFENTKFADVSGLSSGNVSTARELGKLARLLNIKYPYLFDITILDSYISAHTGWINNGQGKGDDAFRGGKHGYTVAANRTFAGFFVEDLLSGNTRTIGYVILGSSDLDSDLKSLRKYTQSHTYFD